MLTDFHPVAPRHAAKRPGRRPHRCAHQHVNRKENRQAVGRQTAYIVLRRQLEDRAVQRPARHATGWVGREKTQADADSQNELKPNGYGPEFMLVPCLQALLKLDAYFLVY